MREDGCGNAECTFAQTGICLLNKDPDECSYRGYAAESVGEGGGGESGDPETAYRQDSETRFPSSNTLGMHDVRTIMGNEYCRIVGLLGVPDSGKTACIVKPLSAALARSGPGVFICRQQIACGARRTVAGRAQVAGRYPGADDGTHGAR